MRLERVAGPFDDPSSVARPATPTCGGCCCCCCCLVTTVTSATLTAVHVNHLAHLSDRPPATRKLATAGAALGAPLALLVAVLLIGSDGELWWGMAGAIGIHLVAVGGAYAGAGADGSTVTIATLGVPFLTAALFVGELFSFGLLFYGQALALIVPPVAGTILARRLRAKRS